MYKSLSKKRFSWAGWTLNDSTVKPVLGANTHGTFAGVR